MKTCMIFRVFRAELVRAMSDGNMSETNIAEKIPLISYVQYTFSAYVTVFGVLKQE
jgi:hypothetical protein